MLTTGAGISAVADAMGLSRQTIYRIKTDPVWAAAMIAKWSAKRRDAA
jgi:DNA invertase Pin-like site-specific DNA recombinase